MPAINPVNAAQEPDALREALNRILGVRPGEGEGGGQGVIPPQESAVQLPIRDAASYLSAKLETPTAYDPMAAEKAVFDKKLAELQTWAPTGASTAPAAAAASASPGRLSYTEYYRGTPQSADAMKYLGYGFYNKETDLGAGLKWGAGGNPYQYRNEYNTYLNSLPPKTPMAMNEGVDAARAALGRKV